MSDTTEGVVRPAVCPLVDMSLPAGCPVCQTTSGEITVAEVCRCVKAMVRRLYPEARTCRLVLSLPGEVVRTVLECTPTEAGWPGGEDPAAAPG